ncbi:unnamed protein product, partial [Polarella glacialis]
QPPFHNGSIHHSDLILQVTARPRLVDFAARFCFFPAAFTGHGNFICFCLWLNDRMLGMVVPSLWLVCVSIVSAELIQPTTYSCSRVFLVSVGSGLCSGSCCCCCCCRCCCWLFLLDAVIPAELLVAAELDCRSWTFLGAVGAAL